MGWPHAHVYSCSEDFSDFTVTGSPAFEMNHMDMAAELFAAADSHIAMAAELSIAAAQHGVEASAINAYSDSPNNVVPMWWSADMWHQGGAWPMSQKTNVYCNLRPKKQRGKPLQEHARTEVPREVQENLRTTLLFRNIPFDYTRDMVIDVLNDAGFHARYNFVYLPIDFNRFEGFGYAVANFLTHEDAECARTHFNNADNSKEEKLQAWEATWNEPAQGLRANIERYRNSSVMHDIVPEDIKPCLLRNGVRVQFPRPAKPVKPPRIRKHRLQILQAGPPGLVFTAPSDSSSSMEDGLDSDAGKSQ